MVTGIDIIGLASSGITIFSFLSSLIPGNPEPGRQAVVRVAANKCNNCGGSISEVKLYDDDGVIVGKNSGVEVSRGSWQDIAVAQATGLQAPWVDILGTDDAICIPYISINWADGSQYAWVGDIGYNCGMTWYHGDTYVDDGSYQPRCVWLDGNHEENVEAASMSIHVPSFAGGNKDSDNPSDYCGGSKFHAYRDIYTSDKIVRREERSSACTKQFDSLVVSSFETHNATELCESATSCGPDFVSLNEGVFCDMSSRQTLGVCTADRTTDCYDVEGNALQKRDGSGAHKTYAAVDVWE